ncbi:MAG: 3-keto-5-aminohexanoate cleavage protein [Natrialbaceae archaeon]|nr:3-keto-5-aminohexanoate cleavage protein [Natrialbaceae archaeon]
MAKFYAQQESLKGNDPEKVVISAALTGALTTRDQCPAIPYTPEEIAEDAAEAREAGAAVAHIHARTDSGSPTFETETYRRIEEEVRDRTDIVVNFSTGAIGVPLEERLEYVQEVKPDVAALNMGSMNYAKYSENRESYVFDMIFENPFSEIRDLLAGMQEVGVTPELECFDTGHIGNTRPLLKEGVLERPFHVSLVMGVLGGIPATVENLAHQVRQLPDDSSWQVIGIGRDQWPLVLCCADDGRQRPRRPRGQLLPAQRGDGRQQRRTRGEGRPEFARESGREPATPDEAREIMEIDG